MHSHFRVHKHSAITARRRTASSEQPSHSDSWFLLHSQSTAHHSHITVTLVLSCLRTLTSYFQSFKWKVFLPVLGIFHFVLFFYVLLLHMAQIGRDRKEELKKNKQTNQKVTVGRSFVTVPSDVDLDCKSNNLWKNMPVPGESANHSRLMPLRWRRLIWEIGNHVFIWVFIGIQSTEVKWSQRRDDNSKQAVSLLP